MDKKYQVFISSTYKDLKKERIAARDAVLRTYNFPVGMEQFAASNRPQWDVIKRDIDSSDYYILIIGRCFGTEVPGETISYTQKEFEYARSIGIPILAFIKKKSAKTKSSFIETDKERIRKLNAFIADVETNRTVNYWEDENELKYCIVSSLNDAINDFPRRGWIRCEEYQATPAEAVNTCRDLNDYESSVMDVISEYGDVGIMQLMQHTNLPKKITKKVLESLVEKHLIVQSASGKNVKWGPLQTKDDLIVSDDYYGLILKIMNEEGIISLCGCGTHYWEKDVYRDDIFDIVIKELKTRGRYNQSHEEIIKYNVEKIINEADPTDNECPGCGWHKEN